MWFRHLRLALRHLLQNRTFTFINVVGLSLGIAATLLILRFLQQQLSYDHQFEYADRIYRVSTDLTMSGSELAAATSSFDLAQAMLADFPEVNSATRMLFSQQVLVNRDEEQFRLSGIAMADSTLFDVFSFPLLRGDPDEVLARPQTILLTEVAAARIFKDEEPIGQTITLNNDQEFEVTGLLGEIPSPTHFPAIEGITSFHHIPVPAEVNRWFSVSYHTYIQLVEGADGAELQAKLPEFVERHIGEYMDTYGMRFKFILEPLTGIWLHTDRLAEPKPTGELSQVIAFAAIGLLILVIASINFINLSTARSTRRAVEVGIRKSLGAQNGQLITQFFSESLVLAFISLVLALFLAETSVRWFNRFLVDPISIDLLHNGWFALGILLLFVTVVLLAGTVPAIVYSSFRPAQVLKGQMRSGKKSVTLRRMLVVVQFTISVLLIIGTATVFRQMRHMQNRPLGFDRDQVMVLRIPNDEFRSSLEEIKAELLKSPLIRSAAGASTLPGRGFPKRIFLPEGYSDNEVTEAGLIIVDPDFLETMGMDLAEGRFFEKGRPADSTNFILNVTHARKLGWDQPVGKRFDFPPRGEYGGEVIGVVKDFHMSSLHSPLAPLVLHMGAGAPNFLAIRFQPKHVDEVKDYVGGIWERFAPAWPFEFTFLDEDFDRAYRADRQFGQLFGAFTLMAILIACLGLFGLAAFIAEQRTREIGIRKVLGASTPSLVRLLTRDLLRWVAISNLVAVPVALFAIPKYLAQFAYPVPGSALPYLLALVSSLAIALLTVGGHALHAAKSDPVHVLRSE